MHSILVNPSRMTATIFGTDPLQRKEGPGREALRLSMEDEFVSLLECPVCYSVPVAEIYNCEKGHIICADCKKALWRCALCESKYTEARNFVVESMVVFLHKSGIPVEGSSSSAWKNDPILATCIFKGEGCKKTLPKSQIDQHTKDCQFRPIPCTVESTEKCTSKPLIEVSHYFSHLMKIHQIKEIAGESGIFIKIDRAFMGFDNLAASWPPFYLKYDGQIFLRCASLRNKCITYWIQLIGPDDASRKYQAVISLSSPSKQAMKVSWTIPVHPIRATKIEIEKSKCVASISSSKLLPFCVRNEPYEDRVATHAWICNIALSRTD